MFDTRFEFRAHFKGIQGGNRIIQERKWENLVLGKPGKGSKR